MENKVIEKRISELKTPVSKLISPDEKGYDGLIRTIGEDCTLVEMLNLQENIFFNNYAIASHKLVQKFRNDNDYYSAEEFEQMPISSAFYTRVEYMPFQDRLAEIGIKNFKDLLCLTEEEFKSIKVEELEEESPNRLSTNELIESIIYFVKYHNFAFSNSKPLVSLSEVEVSEFNRPYIYTGIKKGANSKREGDIILIKNRIAKLRNASLSSDEFLNEYNNILDELEKLLEEYINKEENFTRKRS